MAYPTLQDIKDYIGIVDATDDAWLQLTLDAVTDAIEAYCERQFELEADVAEYPEAENQQDFYVYRYPLISIESMTVDDSAMDAVNMRIVGNIGKVLLAYPRTGDVIINYTGGYSVIPPSIVYVINESVKRAYEGKSISSTTGGIKSERIDGVVTTSYFDTGSTDSAVGGAENAPDLIAPYALMLDSYMSDTAVGGVV